MSRSLRPPAETRTDLLQAVQNALSFPSGDSLTNPPNALSTSHDCWKLEAYFFRLENSDDEPEEEQEDEESELVERCRLPIVVTSNETHAKAAVKASYRLPAKI